MVETEVLWVTYRNRQRAVTSLEVHRLQAIVPLTGEIIHVVASSREDGSPDEGGMSAFRVPVGQGICMRPGCWHATRVEVSEVLPDAYAKIHDGRFGLPSKW